MQNNGKKLTILAVIVYLLCKKHTEGGILMRNSVKKTNIVLLLVYLLLPIVVGIVVAYFTVKPDGEQTVATNMPMIVVVAVVGYFLTFFIVAPLIMMLNKKKFRDVCKENGCNYDDYFFKGQSTLVAVDTNSRKMGLLFKYNPTQPYVVSLDQVTEAKSSNGVNSLSLGGTREVYFTFRIDGVRIKVRTFLANSTYSLSSPTVMEAITKADYMVNAING